MRAFIMVLLVWAILIGFLAGGVKVMATVPGAATDVTAVQPINPQAQQTPVREREADRNQSVMPAGKNPHRIR